MQQPFPCGVGVEISAGRNYQPIMMGNSRVNDSIVWIRYETRHIPYDVRTFLHKRGEKKLFIPDGRGKFRLVRVDGYIAHTKTCLEYLECRLVSVPPFTPLIHIGLFRTGNHGLCNRHHSPNNKTMIQQRKETEERLQQIRKAGFYVRTKWSCDFEVDDCIHRRA